VGCGRVSPATAPSMAQRLGCASRKGCARIVSADTLRTQHFQFVFVLANNIDFIGAARGIRTPDPIITNYATSQQYQLVVSLYDLLV
jgi:hypothetical protein